jgi:hypothetical protein
MPFSKSLKYLVLTTIVIVAIVVGGNAYLGYSLRHMQLDFPGLDVLVYGLKATVEIATLTVPIHDLDKLPSFHNADKLKVVRFKKSCSIYVHPW